MILLIVIMIIVIVIIATVIIATVIIVIVIIVIVIIVIIVIIMLVIVLKITCMLILMCVKKVFDFLLGGRSINNSTREWKDRTNDLIKKKKLLSEDLPRKCLLLL